jgi:hypothetical protein
LPVLELRKPAGNVEKRRKVAEKTTKDFLGGKDEAELMTLKS